MELDFFKAEHVALIDLCGTLLDTLQGPPDYLAASMMQQKINRLLVSHLAKEDEHLYPALKRDPRTAATATRFEQELGGLATVWRGFMRDWPQDRIARDWGGFGAETRQVLAALAERARREEEELYPLLADKSWPDAA